MAKRLEDAVAAIQRLVGQINGIKFAPADIPERANVFPFALTFPTSGEWIKESYGSGKGLHTITLEIHTARKNLPRDIETIIPFGELVAAKLLSDTNLTLPDATGAATVETITEFTYEFGPLGYADVPTIGWSFTIGVKILGSM